MDIKIDTAAHQLAMSFLDEIEIPLRFRQNGNESTRKQKNFNTDSLIEKNFNQEVAQWKSLIVTMLSKLNKSIAWRFINLKPLVDDKTIKLVDCQDFCDFTDYIVLRRDIEDCPDEELGKLSMLSFYFQKEIEKTIKPIEQNRVHESVESCLDFVTIDFETATSDRHSPCEIGLTIIRKGKIIETKSWLIKPFSYPFFEPFNVMIHGISANDVADKPEFPEIWGIVKPLLDNKIIIAHNAGFDISVLRKTLEFYNLPYPNLKYACSYIISKKVWSGLPAYDLKTLCQINEIKLNHHRAGHDSRACAELVLKAFDKTETTTITEFPEKLKTTVGQLFIGGYKPCESKRINSNKSLSLIVGDTRKHNPESIFYGKTIVFTGTLSSMIRLDAQQKVADIGGHNSNSITNETDFLIVGQQDYRIVGEDGMSSKQEKAIQLIKKGSELEIISEEDFLKNL